MRALLILAALNSTAAIAVPLTPTQIADIDRIATGALRKTGVPSASIAVVTDGKLQFAKAYGTQRTSTDAPSADAAYSIASVSKQVIGAAILLLAEEGKLSLDDKVAKYFPQLSSADQVSIRQLLSHTSGYRDNWPQNYSFAATTRPTTPAAILQGWASTPLDFKPGDQWQYSNTGYVIAGRIIELASGQPLMAFLQKRIFQPLGMKVADVHAGLAPTDAQPFTRFALGPLRPSPPLGRNWFWASGQLVATPSEWSKWSLARLDRMLLRPASWSEQEREIMLNSGKGTGYGLGVNTAEVRGHRRISHGGAGVGFLTEDRSYPADRAAVIVFVNADFGNAHTAIADGIEEMILGSDPDTGAARAMFAELRRGEADRSRYTANFNAYLTPQVLADHRQGLESLGEPQSFVRLRPARLRGGFTSEVFEVRYPDRKLTISMRAEPDGGKVEEFLIYPAAD